MIDQGELLNDEDKTRTMSKIVQSAAYPLLGSAVAKTPMASNQVLITMQYAIMRLALVDICLELCTYILTKLIKT